MMAAILVPSADGYIGRGGGLHVRCRLPAPRLGLWDIHPSRGETAELHPART